MTKVHAEPCSHLLDVYSCWLHVATNRDQWRTLRARIASLPKKPPHSMAGTRHEAEVKDTGAQVQHFVVYLDVAQHDLGDQAETDRVVLESCAHEAAHVAGMVLDHLEHEYGGCDEPHAYLVGWITQWLWQATRPTRPAQESA